MIKHLKLTVTALALLLCAAVMFGAHGRVAHAAAPQQPAARAPVAVVQTLTPQERRGKAIYLRGESPSGNPITAIIGEVDVPATTMTCAGCHGLRAEGKTEGGVTAGDLTWANLTKPYGHTHPTGRKHGPYQEAAFIRSVVNGVDPAGNELATAMPRFKMSPADMADLIAYLKRIETDRDPGLTETSIKVGALLPATGALADTGAAMRDVLTAYFDDVNSRGGIYNRRLELRVADSGTDAATSVANVRRLLASEQVFTLVGGISAGADKELAALAAETETPFIGPSTLLPQTGTPLNRYVFYLLPGLAEQARALVNFAAERPELKKARLSLVYPEGDLTAAAAAAVEDQAKLAGLSPLLKQPYARGSFNAAQVAERARQSGAEAVFFLGTNGEETVFIKAAAAANWTPYVLLLGAMTGRDLGSSVPASFKDKVFLAFPTVPSDITPEGMTEFRALHEKYKFPARHTASQLAAFAAAKVFVEGLKLAGQDLSREKLVTALEGLYDYDTGVMPRLTFGPNRRVGAAGASVATIDPVKKEFVLIGGWVKAN